MTSARRREAATSAPSGLLPRAFFEPVSADVAPRLLGAVIEHETDDGLVAVRLTEVEAYHGGLDPASHAFRGKTTRNAVMFGQPGHVYVYFTYGMHYCMNVVCDVEGTASAVLLRAGEVVDGLDLAVERRRGARVRELARGPARLTTALGITRSDNGRDACDPGSALRLRAGTPVPVAKICRGPRVGVAAAADTPWRFWIDGDETVSAYRKHTPRRRPASPDDAARSRTQGFSA